MWSHHSKEHDFEIRKEILHFKKWVRDNMEVSMVWKMSPMVHMKTAVTIHCRLFMKDEGTCDCDVVPRGWLKGQTQLSSALPNCRIIAERRTTWTRGMLWEAVSTAFIPLEITWVLGRLELVQSSHSNIISKGSYVLVSSKDALKVFLR